MSILQIGILRALVWRTHLRTRGSLLETLRECCQKTSQTPGYLQLNDRTSTNRLRLGSKQADLVVPQIPASRSLPPHTTHGLWPACTLAQHYLPIMEPTDKDAASLKLFNDLYFSQSTSTLAFDIFALFPWLPVERRLDIWLLFLQQYRMIDLDVAIHEQVDDTVYYTNLNRLGNIVSARGYTLSLSGRGYALSLSPLLRVNRETRQAALSFYRVHLPFPGKGSKRVL